MYCKLTGGALIHENVHDLTIASPYYLFRCSVRSELTRKYYERRLRRFFDFIGFSIGSGIEERCNLYAEEAKRNINSTIVQIIRFLQYQKERTQKVDITSATLINFVKAWVSSVIFGKVEIHF